MTALTKPKDTVNKEPVKVEEPVPCEVTDEPVVDTLATNVGGSDYSKHKIQPWQIWEEYNLNPWDADLVKRVLRKKKSVGKNMTESRIEDYEKMIHVCQHRINQLKCLTR